MKHKDKTKWINLSVVFLDLIFVLISSFVFWIGVFIFIGINLKFLFACIGAGLFGLLFTVLNFLSIKIKKGLFKYNKYFVLFLSVLLVVSLILFSIFDYFKLSQGDSKNLILNINWIIVSIFMVIALVNEIINKMKSTKKINTVYDKKSEYEKYKKFTKPDFSHYLIKLVIIFSFFVNIILVCLNSVINLNVVNALFLFDFVFLFSIFNLVFYIFILTNNVLAKINRTYVLYCELDKVLNISVKLNCDYRKHSKRIVDLNPSNDYEKRLKEIIIKGNDMHDRHCKELQSLADSEINNNSDYFDIY